MIFRLIVIIISFLIYSSSIGAVSSDDTILILYNHGTSGKDKYDCMKSRYRWGEYIALPKWARELRGRKIEGLDGKIYTIEIEFFCSRNDPKKPHPCDSDSHGNVCTRACKIIAEIEKYAKLYPRKQIFLAGHSAGAWASLLIKRHQPEAVNGLILTAPAFDGKRMARTCRKKKCDDKLEKTAKKKMKIRYLHDQHLSQNASENPPLLDALIIAFPCDAFGWPSELPFTANQGVELKIFPPYEKPLELGKPEKTLGCKENTDDGTFTYYRYYNGEPALFCEKIERRNSFSSPICSSQRIAYCKEEHRELCEEKAHKFYDDYKKRKYFLGMKTLDNALLTEELVQKEIVQNFIKKRLAEWNYGNGKSATEGEPCKFMSKLLIR